MLLSVYINSYIIIVQDLVTWCKNYDTHAHIDIVIEFTIVTSENEQLLDRLGKQSWKYFYSSLVPFCNIVIHSKSDN